ncbi:MAG: hypothetical protein ACKVPY_18260 [Paracoccaceae bacterium]
MPGSRATLTAIQNGVPYMWFLSQISFDEIVGSFLACLILREAMILALPDTVAGPGGWLIDTGHEDA